MATTWCADKYPCVFLLLLLYLITVACILEISSGLCWHKDECMGQRSTINHNVQLFGSGGIEKSHSCKWAKWIQWHALPHIQQSTQQWNKGHNPNLHGWDFSIPPSPTLDKFEQPMCNHHDHPMAICWNVYVQTLSQSNFHHNMEIHYLSVHWTWSWSSHFN